MFDDISYCTRVEHEMLNISHNEVNITKGYIIYGLYTLEGSNIVVHSSSTIEDFN